MYKTKVSHNFMKKIEPNFFLFPWDHIRVPGYPFRDPRVPICCENIFSPIIGWTVVINIRVYYILSKDSDFFGPGSQF